MQSTLKYKLLKDLLLSWDPSGQAFGIGTHLQLQELLAKLPDDLPLEEYKSILAPVFVKNKQEQAQFYELFEQSLKRVRAFEAARPNLMKPPVDEASRWRYLVYALLAVMALGLGLLLREYLFPLPISKPEVKQLVLERNSKLSERIVIRGDDTLSTVLFSEGQTFGGDTTMLTWTVDADNLEIVFTARDTTTYQNGPIDVLVQTIYTEPPIDTIIYKVTIKEQTADEPEPEVADFEPLELQPIPFPRDINELNVDLKEQARADFYKDNAWWIKLMIIGLIGAIFWAILKWREQQQRQLVAEIESRDQAPYIWNIELNEGTNIVMNESFRTALTRLRQRSKEDIYKLDIPRTVEATIKKAGLIDFQYKQETRQPEYLLLIERDNPKDHRALVFDALFQSFRQNEVLVERYYFNGDIRTCYNETHPWGVNIKDLQHQYSAARLLIIGNGYRLLNPVSGKLARWTSIFKNWRDRAILSPLALGKWGRKERQLTNLFHYLPATVEGLKATLEQFEALEPKPNEQVLNKIKDAATAPIALKGDLIESLQAHFPERMLQWIAACAIYPSLHWDLTLFLGQELSDEGDSLLTLEKLLRLTRLPWFVEGKIPDAARGDLIEYLAKANLEEPIRRKIDAVLQKAPKPESNSVAYDDYRMNVILNELLFTKDRQKKKELEEEFAQYLAAGNEPDFMVFKYLDREPTRFDFLVPHSWKRYVAPGEAFLLSTDD